MVEKSKETNQIAYIILKLGFNRKQTKTEAIKKWKDLIFS